MKSKGYKIASYFIFKDEKMSFDVILKKRVQNDRLTQIATKLYSDHNGIDYNRVFICFYLCPLDIGHGAWATANYTPILDVKVWGKEREEYDKARDKRNQ